MRRLDSAGCSLPEDWGSSSAEEEEPAIAFILYGPSKLQLCYMEREKATSLVEQKYFEFKCVGLINTQM